MVFCFMVILLPLHYRQNFKKFNFFTLENFIKPIRVA